jgi:hypothetical protein
MGATRLCPSGVHETTAGGSDQRSLAPPLHIQVPHRKAADSLALPAPPPVFPAIRTAGRVQRIYKGMAFAVYDEAEPQVQVPPPN